MCDKQLVLAFENSITLFDAGARLSDQARNKTIGPDAQFLLFGYPDNPFGTCQQGCRHEEQ